MGKYQKGMGKYQKGIGAAGDVIGAWVNGVVMSSQLG